MSAQMKMSPSISRRGQNVRIDFAESVPPDAAFSTTSFPAISTSCVRTLALLPRCMTAFSEKALHTVSLLHATPKNYDQFKLSKKQLQMSYSMR